MENTEEESCNYSADRNRGKEGERERGGERDK